MTDRTAKHELIINFEQSKDNVPTIDSFQSIWTETWNRFETDICSYILPAMNDSEEVEVQEQKTWGKTKSAHSFSFPRSTRQLKRVIIMHSSIDIFPEIRKEITRIFYRITNCLVNSSLNDKKGNLFVSLIEGYEAMYDKLGVIISCLNMVLSKYISRKGIEDELYSILNKELMNHLEYENFINSCMGEVEKLRNSCLILTQPFKEESTFKEIEETIANLKLLNKLKIFPYVEYLERSKKYYSELLNRIPKNISMFLTLYNFIKCEKILENTITADEEKLENAKKILKSQPWRPLEQESLTSIFCKEVLEEIYDNMIEYVDYLLDFEDDEENGNSSSKNEVLRYLWQLTKVLESTLKSSKEREKQIKAYQMSGDRKNLQVINPSLKLLNRITSIIWDIKKYIGNEENKEKCDLYKIIHLREHLLSVISECFENDSKFLNSIVLTIEEVIVSEEERYNSQLCKIILHPSYIFPGASPEECKMVNSNIMRDEVEEKQLENKTLNDKFSYQLFKLTPSKEQFIRKLEQEFSNYVIPFSSTNLDLTQQELFIKPIQKECGLMFSKNIERMLTDVWRQGEMVYSSYGKMICRVLCQDWPSFHESKFKLADNLIDIRSEFEEYFLSQIENEKKKLRWVQECGRLTIAISGIESQFSELQSSIIVLLSRSYRPIKKQQFQEVLEYNSNDLGEILSDLVVKNVLIFNNEAANYEINYDNTLPYQIETRAKASAKREAVSSHEKDYVIIVEAFISRILKRRKSVQKTDLAKLMSIEMRVDARQPTIEEINNALERLVTKGIINIESTRGIIKYID